jgi:hypothetical protein
MEVSSLECFSIKPISPHVIFSVVRFFLLERTSGLILTFKNLCGGSSGKGLNQVLPNC